jgi:hypothetical protein
VGYALILILIGGYLGFALRSVGNRISEVSEFITRPEVLEAIERLNELTRGTSDIERISNQFNARLDWEETMPAASSHLLEQVIFGHGLDVTVNSFYFDETLGTVRISAVTPDARIATRMVRVIYDMGIADYVIYAGYGSSGLGFSFGLDIELALGGDE